MKTSTNKTSGFTLVELAIVLVIIGLIIGGVLVGQDLIKAATIRSTVSDVEKFNAGATTFRGKYNGLPGDLTAQRAFEFGLSTSGDANSTGLAGLRDGNGVIEGGAANSVNLAGEIALLWQDLGKSGLIAGTYPGIGVLASPAGAVGAATIGTYLPHAKLRDTASYYVYSKAGRNFFYLGQISVAAGGAPQAPSGKAVTPLEAKGIDEKIDDGIPLTGVVLAMDITDLTLTNTDPGTGAPAITTCMNNVAASNPAYNVSSLATGASSNVVCALQLRTSF